MACDIDPHDYLLSPLRIEKVKPERHDIAVNLGFEPPG
jgi:hypothetical protein